LAEHGKSLSERTIKAGFWVFALRSVNRLFQLVRTIVLARLLSPNDFGLFGIALLALSALDTFSQTGFKQALIQKKEDTNPFLNTAWTLQIIRGILIALIIFFVAPYVAIFFKAPAAEPILKVIGLAIVLHSLTNIAVVYFEKELEFQKFFKYQFLGTIADVIVAISAAILLRSVWALVFGLLAGNLVRCVMSYIIDPYRPKFQFNGTQAKELFRFGRWILGSSIVVFLANQGGGIFLGKILGATTLGLYQMAFRFANLPASQMGVLSRVAFPAYSKLQDNISKLRSAYLKMLRFVTFFSIPFAGGIFILGPEFTQVFLGDKWMPIISALRILAISVMIRTVVGTGGALFNAVGRPDMDFKMNVARVITLAVTIYPLTMRWKISGTSLSVLLAACACIPIWISGSKREAKVRAKDYFKTLLPPLIGTMMMFGVIFALRIFFHQFQLIGFLISVFTGIIVYFGFTFLVEKNLDYPIFEDLRFIFSSLKIK